MFAAHRANEYAVKGQWDEAVAEYGALVQDEPENVEFRIKYRRAKTEAAQVHFQKGEKYLEESNFPTALAEFQTAFLLDHTLVKAETSIQKTKKIIESKYYYEKGLEAAKNNRTQEAVSAFKNAVNLNPKNISAVEELEKINKQQKLVMDGYELRLTSDAPITLEFRDTGIKKVLEIISKLSGINFIFDEDVQDKRTTIFLKNATFQEAFELILATNKLSRKIVNENTIIVYPATPQKSQQYEELVIKVFYLTNIDAKKTINLLKSLLKAKDIYPHESLNAIVIRAKPDVLDLAQKILYATDLADSEIMLAVDILEINRNKALKLGIDISPDTITASVPQTGGSISISDLRKLSSGDLLLSLPSVILNLKREDLDANILSNPRIRVKNNEKAKIHIGDRVPIITTTVNQGVSTENIQYVDVGIKFSVEPIIRQNDEVDLKVGLEVSSLGTKTITSSGSVAYQIGTRNTETFLRLHDGETQIIGGLISDEERSTIAKIPFLGDVPILGKLFSSTDQNKVKTDILLSITPHIIRKLEVPESNVLSFPSGIDDQPSGSAFKRFDPENQSGNAFTGTNMNKETTNLETPSLLQSPILQK